MDAGDVLYDEDTNGSPSRSKTDRWNDMSPGERNRERAQRKKERRKKNKKGSNDNTVIEDLEDLDYNDWDDDDEAGDEHEVMSPETNGRDDGVFDDPEFMKTAVEEHARYLGMDPENPDHAELLWIAEEALTAPLPEDWEQGVTDDGTPYFFNVETKESVWDHPLDAHYQQMFEVELKKLKKLKKKKKAAKKEHLEKEAARKKKEEEEKRRRKEREEAEAERERERIRQEELVKREKETSEKAERQQQKRVKRNRNSISESLSSNFGDSLDLALGGSSVSRINTSKSTSPIKSKKMTTEDVFSIKSNDVSPNTKWKNEMADLVVEDDIDEDNQSMDFETSTELDETSVMVGSVRMNNNNNNAKSYGKFTKPSFLTSNNTNSNNNNHNNNSYNMNNSNNNNNRNNNNPETISTLESQIKKLNAEKISIESTFQIELERHKGFANEYKKECDDLRTKITELKTENKKSEKGNDENIKELKDKLNKLVKEKENIETVEFDLKKEKARADGFENEAKELREKLLQGEESVRSAERDKEEMESKLKSANDKMMELIQESVDNKKKITNLQSQLTTKDKQLEVRKDVQRDLQNDNEKMEQEFKSEKKTLNYRTKELEEELKKSNTKAEDQKNQIYDLKQNIQEKLKNIETLKEKYDDFEMATKAKLSNIESEQVRRVKKDMLDEMLEIKNKHRVAIEVADAKRLKLEKEIQDSKIMAAKATETLESRINALKNNLLEVEEERNTAKRELQESVERLAVVESMRNADHEECVQHRRTVLQVKEENEDLRRKLVNSKDEENLMKITRKLENMTNEKKKLENENKDLTLKLDKSKVQFKAMIETAMRRAANEASQDTALEWQKRLDQEILEAKQEKDELRFQVKDSNDQLRQRDKELVEFERKYARSSASLEVSQKEVNYVKTEMEDLKRQLRTATEKIVYQNKNNDSMVSNRNGHGTVPPAPETMNGPGLSFSVPQQSSLLLNNSANTSLEQSMQVELLQQHLSLLKTQAAAAASMVAQVENSAGRKSLYEDIRTVPDEREEDDYRKTVSSALEMSGRTHQVLSDLNISYGRKGPLGSTKSFVSSSPVVPGLKSRSVYGGSTALTLSGTKKNRLGRDSWYKKGYWKSRYQS